MSLNVVDSSAWLEYLADTPRAKLFAGAIEDADNLVVPVIVLYEVCKKVRRERGEDAVLQVAAAMESGRIVTSTPGSRSKLHALTCRWPIA